jgi:pilus assembly protein CpaB
VSRRIALLIVAIIIAAVGTGLVFLYAHNANDRALADQNPQQVLVAKNTIASGTSVNNAIAHGDLVQQTIPAVAVIPGALRDVSSMGDLVALSTIFPGQQIVAAEFGSATQASSSGLALTKGQLAISVQLADPNRVAGFVQPGSEVAIFLSGAPVTTTTGGKATTITRLLLPKIEIIAVGPTTVVPAEAGKANPEAVPRALMTLAVSQQEAEKIITAQSSGELWFGLLNGQSIIKADKGVSNVTLFR